MAYQHSTLAAGKWHSLTLAEQLGNIGSEVSRAMRWHHNDGALFRGAVDRALELFDLTIGDSRWRARLKEVVRAREVFCDAVAGGQAYGSSLESLSTYFTYFALLARAGK